MVGDEDLNTAAMTESASGISKQQNVTNVHEIVPLNLIEYAIIIASMETGQKFVVHHAAT